MDTNTHPDLSRRPRHAFWALVLLAALAAGALSTSLEAPASASTGLRVAASGLVLVGAVGLAARVLFALERAHRQARRASTGMTEPPSQ